MNGTNPGGLVNRVVGWCFGILAGTIALYCAVNVLESIWPDLVVLSSELGQ